ncbi:MAG TPA: NAD(P)-dependent oxidoreductase [Methanosarcina sp.]|nr:NAD(P)-dependent oxidoreductase [Methanosarcina sp.]
MRILITGTTGFLGKSLKEYFDPKHNVIVWGRNTEISLNEAVYIFRPDVVIHCAGEIYKPELMYETNIGLVQELLTGIKDYSPKTRLVTIGSSAEYGPVAHPTSEKDPINPVDVYQATKGAASLLCQGYARQFGLDTCVARIYSGYGPHERQRRLFPTLYRAFFNNESMTLFDGAHDFIYIDDFVRGIDILINSPWPAGEIVNFGSGKQYSNLEVLQAWERVTGKKAPVKYEEKLSKAYESKTWVCDTTYAKEQYGFETQISLEEGIADFIRKVSNAK